MDFKIKIKRKNGAKTIATATGNANKQPNYTETAMITMLAPSDLGIEIVEKLLDNYEQV